MTETSAQVTTHTLDVPGATVTYDVRRNDASTEPIPLLIGSPMGAAGFGTLSQHFSERTVVTYDPRGVERSVTTDPTSPVTPDVHADDLHRLIQAIGGGPVDLLLAAAAGRMARGTPRPASWPLRSDDVAVRVPLNLAGVADLVARMDVRLR